jgi:hypothetical protein
MLLGMIGAGLMIAGFAVTYVLTPTAGQLEKVGDVAAPFMAVLCTAVLFTGAMLLLSAVLF